MEVASLIEEAKRVYAAAGLNCGDGLLPPADEAAIDALGEALSLPVPPELREVYRAHAGQQYISPGVTGLFGRHRLYPPDEVVEQHRLYVGLFGVEPPPRPDFRPPGDALWYWVPRLLPFAGWDQYVLCIDAVSGEVWEFFPSGGLFNQRRNIATVLREVIDAARSGREPVLGAMGDSA